MSVCVSGDRGMQAKRERWRERGTGWECGGGFSGVQREIGEREWVEGGCSEPFILTLPGDIMSV